MKKFLSASALIAFAFVFFSCGLFGGSVKFNLTGAIAVGATGGFSENNRSVNPDSRSVSDDAVSVVKLLESGTLENATSIEGNVELAPVKSIMKSPCTNDLYFWFSDETENALTGNIVLTQLVCVNTDGSQTDLLIEDTQRGKNDGLRFQEEGHLDFDQYGNAYILADDHGWGCEYLYMFNPKTKQRTKLAAFETKHTEEPFVLTRIAVNKSGTYLYAGGNYTSKNGAFVWAFPTNNLSEKKVVASTFELTWSLDKEKDVLYTVECDEWGEQSVIYKYNGPESEREKVSDEVFSYIISSNNGVFGFSKTEEGIDFKKIGGTDIRTITGIQTWSIVGSYKSTEQRGDYLYICTRDFTSSDAWPDYQGNEALYDNDYTVFLRATMLSNLIRINTRTMEWQNVLENCEYMDELHLDTWSVNDNTLYYSGANRKTDVNGKVDLNTLEHTKLSLNQRLSCLAAL